MPVEQSALPRLMKALMQRSDFLYRYAEKQVGYMACAILLNEVRRWGTVIATIGIVSFSLVDGSEGWPA